MRLTRRTLLAAAPVLAAPALVRAEAPLRLTVLHTNDVHSRHEPVNRFGAACRAEDQASGACSGGSARLAAAVLRERADAEAAGRRVLLLDAGDQFMGSLFYTHWRGEAERRVMAAIGYDAMALGNHEFDHGPETIARFVRTAPFPVLGANLDTREEPALAGLVRPWVMLAGGIAVVGAVTAETPRISSPGPRLRFGEESAAVAAAAAEARAAGARAVIALTHVGFARDRAIAAAVPGLAAVVGGHSHTLLSNSDPSALARYPQPVPGPDGRAVPVVQAGANNRFLGRLDLDLDTEGRVVEARGDALPLAFAGPRDLAVEALVAELALPLAALRARVIGAAAAPLPNDACRREECALGNMVAEAMLAAARPSGAEIALQNGGGLRSGLAAGPITWGDLLTVLPFSNTLATLTLAGADLRAALENGFSAVESGAGRFPQLAGLRVVWDPGAPPGRRLVSASVVGPDGSTRPLEDGRLYTIVTNNFLRQGGDGYLSLRDRAVAAYDGGPNIEDVVEAWIAARSPVLPVTDGRITRR
ncbi:5'-nucleotidase C-terminal domain-containing protein [Elioraea tepida]|jgi:5'-nucleotidase|uniref:5'-nucleotidase C-terminal domain-containing protein n=1 Tax=Elioraea tepida TaxID=2843330 RepID=A0A975U2B3_9PROT|nr:5'-nucleotidase C-terminal domain-containing protein [Elioraea tepida]QXM25055.1 5'-nucleotidase C-terminal domain-containing protein [Elioraea tepida]